MKLSSPIALPALRPMQRGLVLCLLLLLQGCSALKLGYGQLPTIGQWWLDSQLSLNATQSDEVRSALRQLQRWHRQSELTGYADLLARLQKMGAADLQAKQVCDVWTQVQEGLDRVMDQAIVLAVPVAMQLEPRQLRHLARHWEDKNEAWEKEWLAGSPQERLQRRLDRTLSRYSDFYGSLGPAQVQLLENQLQTSAWTAEWGRRERLRRQSQLLLALQSLQTQTLTPGQAQAILQGVWRRWLTASQAQDQLIYRTLQEQSCFNLAELHNSTSPEQRQRAMRRLRAYERDLRELAAGP